MDIGPHVIPKLIFHENIFDDVTSGRNHLFRNKLSIYNPINVHRSLNQNSSNGKTTSLNTLFLLQNFVLILLLKLDIIFYTWIIKLAAYRKSSILPVQLHSNSEQNCRLPYNEEMALLPHISDKIIKI